MLSGVFSGITGACYGHLIRYIEPGMVYGLHFSAIPVIFAICGGRFTVIGPALAWHLVQIFLSARFSGQERHKRRLAKVAAEEIKP